MADAAASAETAAAPLTGTEGWAGVQSAADVYILLSQVLTYIIANSSSGLQTKAPVVAASTAAGALATDFANGSALDGVALATGNRVLLKDQAAGAENGIWIVAASGAPTRAADADAGAELINASVQVSGGSVNAGRTYVCTTPATIVPGTTALTFTLGSLGTVFGYSSIAALILGLQGSGLTAALSPRVMAQRVSSVDTTTAAADIGNSLHHPSSDTTARDFTIASEASVAAPVNATHVFTNAFGAGVVTIKIAGGDTLRNAVTDVAGNFTLAPNRLATAIKVQTAPAVWMIA